jgi:hypothetical protein
MRALAVTQQQMQAITHAGSTPCPVRKWDIVFRLQREQWSEIALRDFAWLYTDARSKEAICEVLGTQLSKEEVAELMTDNEHRIREFAQLLLPHCLALRSNTADSPDNLP